MKHLWMECPSCGLKYRNEEYDELVTQRNELVAALLAVTSNIDVSTINNSKRSTERWIELKEQASAAIAKVKEAVDKRMKGE